MADIKMTAKLVTVVDAQPTKAGDRLIVSGVFNTPQGKVMGTVILDAGVTPADGMDLVIRHSCDKWLGFADVVTPAQRG
jgi:hypothetical protein